MLFLLSALLLLSGPARAAASKPAAASETSVEADTGTIALVNYFLKVELSEASPKLVEPFLRVKIDTLPKKLQRKAEVRQTEVAAIVRLHDTRKAGFIVTPAENCGPSDFIKPLSLASAFPMPGYETVTEDELKYVMDTTKCTEIDLGCKFSMLIFFEKKKDRIVKFNATDPLMAKVAEFRGHGGTTHFFGGGMSCMH
jgi:hypothetical protein